jgi:hypothetical protein
MSRPENDSVQEAIWNRIVIEAARRPDTGRTSYFPFGIEEVGLITSIPFQTAIRSIIFKSSPGLSAESKKTIGNLLARVLTGLETQQAIPTSWLQSIKDNNDAVATVANALIQLVPKLIEKPALTAVASTSTDAPRKKPQGPGLFKKALGLGAGALLTAAAFSSGALSGAPQTAPVFTPSVSATPFPTMEVSATPVPTVAGTPLPVQLPQSTSDLDWYGTQRYPIETPSTALQRDFRSWRPERERKDADVDENAELTESLAEDEFKAQRATKIQARREKDLRRGEQQAIALGSEQTPTDFDATVKAGETTAENLASQEVSPLLIEEYVTPKWWIPLQDMTNVEKVRLVLEAIKILEKHVKNEELVPTSELSNMHLALEKDPETGTYSAHLKDTVKGTKLEGGAKFNFHKNWEDNVKFLERFLKGEDKIINETKAILDSIVTLSVMTQVGISGYYPYLAVHEQIEKLEELIRENKEREYLSTFKPLTVHEGGKKVVRSTKRNSRSRRRHHHSRSRTGRRKSSRRSQRYYAYM